MGDVFGFIALTLFNIGCACYCMSTRKETIKRQNTLIADLMNHNTELSDQLSAAREEVEDSHEAIDRLNAMGYANTHQYQNEPKDYAEHDDGIDALTQAAVRAFDRAVEDADHSVIIDGKRIVQSVREVDMLQPTKPWPRPEQNTMHGRITKE